MRPALHLWINFPRKNLAKVELVPLMKSRPRRQYRRHLHLSAHRDTAPNRTVRTVGSFFPPAFFEKDIRSESRGLCFFNTSVLSSFRHHTKLFFCLRVLFSKRAFFKCLPRSSARFCAAPLPPPLTTIPASPLATTRLGRRQTSGSCDRSATVSLSCGTLLRACLCCATRACRLADALSNIRKKSV